MSSCSDDDSPNNGSYLLEIEGYGISATNSSGSTFEIPASGAEFTVTGYCTKHPENLGEFFLREFGVKFLLGGGFYQCEATDRLSEDDFTWDGAWGSFEYITRTPPYVIKFKIKPNTTNEIREITARFGTADGCQEAAIDIIQAAEQ